VNEAGAPPPGADPEGEGDKLVLKFGGSLVEQLGAQLYPSVTATVAELVSNAWDAEAANVWISMPFGTWHTDDRITVTDDGHGMTRPDAKNAYLIVGRKRRLEGNGALSANGLRRVHGRKGIGKLAAFGTAGILECSTVRDGLHTAFRLDYDEIRKLDPSQDYEVEEAEDQSLPTNPDDGSPLDHGTRIILSSLLQKRALGEDQFFRSMARRFAISADEMAVYINGKQLLRFNMDVEFRFPPDAIPEGATEDAGWAIEAIDAERTVRWWLGFTALPLEDETLQGISILANKKMAQRPFLFDRSKGTEGQLGQEYLVGEVQADWIDVGVDVEDDLIQSNRDQLQLEDDRLTLFVEWGRKRLAWALKQRNDLRQAKAMKGFEASPDLLTILEPFTKSERSGLLRVAVNASKLPEMTGDGLVDLMRSVVDARSDTAVRQLIEEIEASDEAVQPRMWELVRQFGLIDARRTYTIIQARLSTITKLKTAVETGAREVPELHKIVKDDPWLLDPRWHLLDDEVDMTKLGIEFEPELDEEGHRLDYMFALIPKEPAPMDEIIVVEIKRGTNKDGSPRMATEAEVNKFHSYVLDAIEHESANHPPALVRGLMIAQGYTHNGDRVKRSLEQNPALNIRFRTWDRVIAETERMHLGWLEVSRLRSRAPDEAGAVASAEAGPVESAPVAAAAAGVSSGGDGVADQNGDAVKPAG
jgi:hypothetical protein